MVTLLVSPGTAGRLQISWNSCETILRSDICCLGKEASALIATLLTSSWFAVAFWLQPPYAAWTAEEMTWRLLYRIPFTSRGPSEASNWALIWPLTSPFSVFRSAISSVRWPLRRAAPSYHRMVTTTAALTLVSRLSCKFYTCRRSNPASSGSLVFKQATWIQISQLLHLITSHFP